MHEDVELKPANGKYCLDLDTVKKNIVKEN